jgi:hypothetical protein
MSIELILVVVVMLASKLGLNNQNSSIPPSKDINPTKPTREKSASRQKARVGKTLTQTKTPMRYKSFWLTEIFYLKIIILRWVLTSDKSSI